MALFPKSVLNKYLSSLDSDDVTSAYEKFKEFYGDAERIENIKLLKEENYQEGFLREIFVQVLGYTINPDKNYNLTTEYKNETDSKKADGAILQDGNAIGVIELKSTKTVNLESITNQAFNCKNHQSKCKFVITSNFEKLNFYIDNATEWEEFNLFTLTEKEFSLFYLLLNAKNLLNDIPLQIKKESRLHEENISDKLYKDYSQFKHKIYTNLVKNNPQFDKLLLFKKSQKLLDRVLFILFAEDSGLVPPNAISKIVDQYEQLKELDEEQSLYSRFVKFFSHLDVGHHYKEYSLPAYNGGLFKEDEILDNVHIDDEILLDDILHLSSYDFSTEVDVNILGHIFEHSLTDIEELTAELEGTLVEREKSKRKKDGIFYTPKYITKYIVDNTIGALCNEKKKELDLDIIDEAILENSKTKQGTLTKKAKKLFDNLDIYRKYVLSLKILDPACGSGAFLNQALEFLIEEHKWIDEHRSSLLKESFTVSEYEKDIVEHNLFGVDINEEAVEIAKLSLWLRTAKKGRKLSTLSNNIKCGNSLIEDPEIAGDKAFNWNEEFPQIFIEKRKQAYHLTWVTHNSRTSERMIKFNVKKGEPFWLTEKLELVVAKAIADIVLEDKLNVLSFNICGDHVHILLVCAERELFNIIRKIKGKSSQKLKEYLQIPKEEKFTLWAQKYHTAFINSEEKFTNTINYIDNNRLKHKLPVSNELQLIVNSVKCNYEHAFRIEYSGGFDVVIGNPPYVYAREKILKSDKEYYNIFFKIAQFQLNTYILFVEKSYNLLKIDGSLGFVIPNSWMMIQSASKLREFLLSHTTIKSIVNLIGYSFENVSVETILIVFSKTVSNENCINILKGVKDDFKFLNQIKQQKYLDNSNFQFTVFLNESSKVIIDKMNINSNKLDDICIVKSGLKAYESGKGIPLQSKEDVKNRPFDYRSKYDESTFEYLEGKDVGRYSLNWSGGWLKYGEHLAAQRSIDIFKGKKIIIREITNKSPYCIVASYSERIFLFNMSNIAINVKKDSNYDLLYVLALLNSSLLSFYFKKRTAKSVRKIFPKIILLDLRNFPIKSCTISKQDIFVEKSKSQLILNKNFHLKVNTFILRITSNLVLEKISNKLKDFYLYDFKIFVNELKKKKIVLSLKQQDEWEEYFNEHKKEILELKEQIDKTDKEIDLMVYKLYSLTYQEVKIIDPNFWLSEEEYNPFQLEK